MTTGLVLSDLHIFSAVSDWEQQLPLLDPLLEGVPVVVLNGDIFDFKRATFSSTAETVRAAVEWLAKLFDAHPTTKFHYVIGNHDAVSLFLTELERLAARYPTLSVHYSHVVVGRNLFLHGDVCHSRMTLNDLKRARSKYSAIEPDPTSIFLAKIVVALRLNLIAHLTHPKRKMCENILFYLREHAPSDLAVAEHIYFGHTHVAFDDFPMDGKIFTNTGGAIRNLKCTVERFEVAR